MVLLVNLFLLGILLSLSQSYQFHSYLNDDEIQKVFHVPRSQVPEYDIVTVNEDKVKKRSLSKQLSIKAFNKYYNLNFELSDGVLMGQNTPVYYANYDIKSGRKVEKFLRTFYDVEMLAYHDAKSKAAVVTSRNKKGQLEIRGTISDDVSIQPLSSYLKTLRNNSFSRINKRSSDYFNDILNENKHIVIRIPNEANDTALYRVHKIPDFNETSTKHTKRAVVDAVYPELLVMLDYGIFRSHFFDINEIIKYTFALYNVVDLRYRSFEQPKIRINIAAIIIEQKPEAFLFFDGNRLGSTKLMDIRTLDSMSTYFASKKFSAFNYDIALVLTSSDLVNVQEDGRYTSTTAGIAFEKGACRRAEQVDYQLDISMGIIQIGKDFKNANVIVHELGHILGASHDGEKEAINCQNGNIMNPETDPFTSTWSSCSQHLIREFLQQPTTSCLRNKPVVKNPFPKIWPGQIRNSLNQQCDDAHKGSVPIKTNDPNFPCKILYCHISDGMMIKTRVLDGTPCKTNTGMCIQGECVLLNDVNN